MILFSSKYFLKSHVAISLLVSPPLYFSSLLYHFSSLLYHLRQLQESSGHLVVHVLRTSEREEEIGGVEQMRGEERRSVRERGEGKEEERGDRGEDVCKDIMHSEWPTRREAEGFEGTPRFNIAPSPSPTPSPHHTWDAASSACPVCLSTYTQESDDVIHRKSGEQKQEAERGEGGGIKEGSTLLKRARGWMSCVVHWVKSSLSWLTVREMMSLNVKFLSLKNQWLAESKTRKRERNEGNVYLTLNPM